MPDPTLDTENPQPGLYTNVPMAVYLALDLASGSRLKKRAISAKKCRHAIDNPHSDDTKDKAFGRLVHVAVLEPDIYDRDWVILPKDLNRKTNKGKEEYANLVLQAAESGGETVSIQDSLAAVAMRESIMADEFAAELLTGMGGNEVTLIWDDEATGLRCKGRSDRMTSYQGITTHVDLKTTAKGGPDGYPYEVRKWQYHVSAAFYLDGCAALEPGKRRFMHIAVEKKPPYDVGVYEFEAAVPGEENQISIDEGRRFYRTWLAEYKKSLDSGEWPSYGGIHPLYI